jgi:hypothetical protein
MLRWLKGFPVRLIPQNPPTEARRCIDCGAAMQRRALLYPEDYLSSHLADYLWQWQCPKCGRREADPLPKPLIGSKWK